MLSAAEAVELDFTPEVLTRDQLKIIETVADQLVPGSANAGIAAYLDAQLRAGNDSLLIQPATIWRGYFRPNRFL